MSSAASAVVVAASPGPDGGHTEPCVTPWSLSSRPRSHRSDDEHEDDDAPELPATSPYAPAAPSPGAVPVGPKISIVGSRGFQDAKLLAATMARWKPSLIISGGARGADMLGEQWAYANGIPTRIFKPSGQGRAAFVRSCFARNTDIVEACDILVAFWDGESRGTQDSVQKGKKFGKVVHVIRYTTAQGCH